MGFNSGFKGLISDVRYAVHIIKTYTGSRVFIFSRTFNRSCMVAVHGLSFAGLYAICCIILPSNRNFCAEKEHGNRKLIVATSLIRSVRIKERRGSMMT